MSLNFNSNGDLSQTIGLQFKDFKKYLGTNEHRLQLIDNAMPFFRIFHKCGCTTAYIAGSFVTQKRIPKDIDICFDITGIQKATIEKEIPEFFDRYKKEQIRMNQKCHLFVFQKGIPEILDFFSEGRDGNAKGMIKLDLTDILRYDQK